MTSIRTRLIGREMQNERIKHGKTLQQIGDALGVTRATISAWETGTNSPAVDSIADYCDYLGIDYLELLENVQKQLHKLDIKK